MRRQITPLIRAESVAETDVAGADGLRQCPPRTRHFVAQNEARPGSMRAWARFILGDEMARTWRALPQTVRTGDIGFRHAFGTDQRSYLATHPDFATLFNTAMLSGTQGINAEIGAQYPFGNFGWIVDVGGGIGTLLLPILDRHPEMRGTIFEFPDVAAQARERIAAAGLAARCDAVDGDARITTV